MKFCVLVLVCCLAQLALSGPVPAEEALARFARSSFLFPPHQAPNRIHGPQAGSFSGSQSSSSSFSGGRGGVSGSSSQSSSSSVSGGRGGFGGSGSSSSAGSQSGSYGGRHPGSLTGSQSASNAASNSGSFGKPGFGK